MKILHFATHDIFGGAAKAAYRLHQALGDADQESRLLVKHKRSADATVHRAPVAWLRGARRTFFHVAQFRKWFLPKPSYTFNLDVRPVIDLRVLPGDDRGRPDVVYLHWVAEFLGPDSIRRIHDRLQCPLVWVLMDLEPITGGCHYSFGCDGYTRSCGRCPLLGSRKARDWSRRTWERKSRELRPLPITFVAPTGWVERRLRESSLFAFHRVERIPLAVDAAVLRPVERGAARRALGVPEGTKAIFFGSHRLDDPRKGMTHLAEALRILAARPPGSPERGAGDVTLLIAGREGGEIFSALPFPRIDLGYLEGDEKLALAYQAADLFVCPSVEDAGPMMIPESMMCGTPVVAFDTGGAPDLVETGVTGYLARMKDSADLAEGIRCLLTRQDLSGIRESARRAAVARHAPEAVAARHLELCRDLVRNRP